MKHKSYQDIEVAKENNIQGFEVGDRIVIQTKVDGANAAIRYDAETDTLVAQSRKKILDMSNTLNGFYGFVQGLDKDKFKAVLGDNLIAFGEWNCRHTVQYAPEYVNKFFMFDVYDTEIGQYLAQDDVHKIADALGLQMVETFYDGPFVSWNHCRSFLDASVYGETMQEGIVVKNITKLLRDRDRTQLSFDDHYFFGPAYLKIVNDAFRETKAHSNKPKETDPEVRQRYLDNIKRAKDIVTERRVEKAIQKAQDNGELPSALSMKDMGMVCRVIPKAVYEDCLKEERDTALAIDDFSKICSKVSIDYAKTILMTKNI